MCDYLGVERHARRALAAMDAHLPRYHPSIALMAQHLGTALSYHGSGGVGGRERLQKAFELHTRAVGILCIAYGEAHEATIRARALQQSVVCEETVAA
jgi:hypothetical protein